MAEVNEKQQFKCLGDCLNCRAVNDRKQQWWYCAAQFSYNASQMMRKMQESLDAMSKELEDMKKKISLSKMQRQRCTARRSLRKTTITIH